jgi:competence protein ComEC
MKFWKQYPLLRIFIAYTMGLISVLITGYHTIFPFYFLLIPAFIIFILAYFSHRFISYRYRWIYGAIVSVSFFLLGMYVIVYKTQINRESHFGRQLHDSDLLLARICEYPQLKEKSVKLIVSVNLILSGKYMIKTTGKAVLYVRKDAFSEKLEYGDALVMKNKLSPVTSSGNPHEFDYKRYLEYRNINYRAYLSENEWKLLPGSSKNLFEQIIYYSGKARNYMLEIFNRNGLTGREYAVASALILGFTDNLDADILSEFSATGAMHILSVSGLHVGIIFIVLSFVLSFLDKNKAGSMIKSILLISFVWFYAFITGLSPPVLRSAFMITVVILGKALRKETDIYNSLLVSAFLLLLIDPYNIVNVGFQLTYLAVAGIAFINPYFSRLWVPMIWTSLKTKNKFILKFKKLLSFIVENIWSITTVSIAAQLLTFPLGLYYFHQFPVYFLITNLIVIPLSTVIIYIGVLILVIFPVPFFPAFFTRIFAWLITLMNSVIHTIEQLPGSLLKGIYISAPESLAVYLLVLLSVLYLFEKKTYLFKYILGVSLILVVSFTYRKYSVLNQSQMIVYQVKKSDLIEFIEGDHAYLTGDSLSLKDEKKINFSVKNNHICSGIREIEYLPLNKDIALQKFGNMFMSGNFIQFKNQRIVWVNSVQKCRSKVKLKCDYLVIAGNPYLKIADLLRLYEPERIIIGSSCSSYRSKRWEDECNSLGVPCYSVINRGAFVAEI